MAVFYTLLGLSLCLLLGTVSQPVSLFLVIPLLLIALLIFKQRRLPKRYSVVSFLAVISFSYGCLWVQWSLAKRLPLAQDKAEMQLRGQIIKVERQQLLQRVYIQLQQSNNADVAVKLRQVRLNYYQQEPQLSERDIIFFTAVLRSPHALLNGLAFDYEAWLLGQGIDATGYIKSLTVIEKAERSSLRTRLLEHWQEKMPAEQWPWLAGLVFGEQDAFDNAQWQLAKDTGTLHLLVVSGMHMGLIVLLLLLLWGVLLRCYALLWRHSSRHLVLLRSIFLLSGAAGYLWLAGAGIALQRAWLMLAVAVLLLNIRQQFNWLNAIACAVLVVLLVNPLAWLSAGFMYSFAAVLALLLFFNGRKSNKLEALWLPQWVVFLALLPLFLFWQQPVSLLQLLANMLAIPWFTLVLMPLTLSTLLLPDFGQGTWLVEAGNWFWQWLDFITNIPLSRLNYLPSSMLFVWLLWLLVLRSGVNYWLARAAVITVLLVVFCVPATQQNKALMLDVGQGQSLVFTSKEHSLVYDSGPFMGEFDSGEAIVKPVLHSLGVNHIDHLVISHQDNDHAGGTAALLRSFPVHSWWGGEPLTDVPSGMHLCSEANNNWQTLDLNLLYRYLNVSKEARQYLPSNHNNHSCVLQLQWYQHTFLLVGDISKAVEYQLIREFGEGLRSDILVLAHHGSKTSSSEIFLTTVKPSEVWVSAGFKNRFNHPAAEVVERLQQLSIPWKNTAEVGQIRMNADGTIHTLRQNWQPPWRNLDSSLLKDD